jgi:hypothetical protein
MAKKPIDILNELARPVKADNEVTIPKDYPSKLAGQTLKKSHYVAKQYLKSLELAKTGQKLAGKGRPTTAAVAAKEKKGKGLSKYSDKDEKEGIRDITLIATVKCDGKTKKEEKVLKDAKTADLEKLIKAFEKELYKKYDYECDITAIDHKMGEWETSDKANNYERGDVEGGEHIQRSSAKK